VLACNKDTCAGPIGFHSFIAAVEFFRLWVPYLAHRNTGCLSVTDINWGCNRKPFLSTCQVFSRSSPWGTERYLWQRQIPLPVTSWTSPPTKPLFPSVAGCGSLPRSSRFQALLVSSTTRHPGCLRGGLPLPPPQARVLDSKLAEAFRSARPPACCPPCCRHRVQRAKAKEPCASWSVGSGNVVTAAGLRRCRVPPSRAPREASTHLHSMASTVRRDGEP
jgi:hypothetical protein